MQNIRSGSWALAALVLSAAPAVGQVSLPSDNTGYGTTSAEFLLLGASARGMALGGAFASIVTDVSALYHNPAGLAQIEGPSAMLSTYSYIANTKYTWGGIAFPMSGGTRSFGFQIGNFGFGDQPVYTVTNPDGDGTKYSVSETFVGLSIAQNFSDRFSAGITGKLISDKLGKTSASGVAVDFGTSFHAVAVGRPIRASFVIQNLGTTLRHDGSALDITVERPPVPGQVDVPQEPQPAALSAKDWGLPVVFRVGVAFDVLAQQQRRVTVLSEFSQPNSSRAGFGLGGEFMMSDIGKTGFFASLRGSWSYQSDNNMDISSSFATGVGGQENRDGLAAGFGVGYRRGDFGLGVDYAYRSMGVIGGTNILTMSLSW